MAALKAKKIEPTQDAEVVKSKVLHPQKAGGRCSKNDLTNPLLTILSAVAVVVGILYVYPYMMSLFGKQKEVFTNIEQLGQRHLELEQKVEEMQNKLGDISSLVKRIDALEQQNKVLDHESVGISVDALKRTDKNTVQSMEVLKNRLDSVETKIASRQQQMIKLPEAIGVFEKLRDRMQTEKPFSKELGAAMARFDPEDEAMQSRLAELKLLAPTGVATLEGLTSSFRLVAKDIRRLAIPEDAPWYSKFAQQMRNLVVVRKNGEALAGGGAGEDLLSRVQFLLENNQLEEALKEAQALQTENSELFAEWKVKADRRLFLDKSIPIMEAHVLAYLLMGGGEHDVPMVDSNKQGS